MMIRRLSSLALLTTLASLLTSCASMRTAPATMNEIGLAWLGNNAAVSIEEAYSSDNELVCRFRVFPRDSAQSRVFYARSVWEIQKVLANGEVKALTVPLEFMGIDEYLHVVSGLQSVEMISGEEFTALRAKLAQELTPREPGKGIQLEIGRRSVVLFSDAEGQLVILDPEDKPAALEVVRVYSDPELTKLTLEILTSTHSGPESAPHAFVALAAGVAGAEIPFIYFDTHQSLAIGFETPASGRKNSRERPLGRKLESVYYLLVDGHAFGMITRPVSSAYRFIAWTTDVAFEFIKPGQLLAFVEHAVETAPPPPIDENAEPMDLAEWENELDEIIGRESSIGTMDFCIGGDEFFPALIEAIDAAEKSIDVRIFIFDNDDYAVSLADLLKRKSNEGVKVRILLDRLGQIMGEGKVPEDLPPGFEPPSSMAAYLLEGSKIKLRVQTNAWLKSDHVKTIVIDRQVCFTGGMNFGREYRYHWRDMMMKVDGTIVSEIMADFGSAWARASRFGDFAYAVNWFSSKRHSARSGGYPIRTLFTRPGNSEIYVAQLRAIQRAQRQIIISNAYFSDNAILNELIRARRRGVDVRVVLPADGNHEIMNASNMVTANLMYENGIQVYFYPGMSHVKAAIFDGWICAGSANFDRLSLKDNAEMNLATSDPAAVEALRARLFEEDLAHSILMKETLSCSLGEYLAEIVADQL